MSQDLNQVATDLGNEGMRFVREICDVAWTRLPGSENEAKAQEFIKRRFPEYGAEDVSVRNYKVYSKFFMWWPRLSIFFFFISFGLYTFFPLLGLLFAVLTAVNLIMKIFSFTFLDVFFKANPSSNVIAKLKAKKQGSSGKPKRVLIIGGHTDSNYEYPIGKKMGTKMIKVVIPVFIAMAIWILIVLVKSILFGLNGKIIGDAADAASVFTKPDWFFILYLLFLPYMIWVGFWMVSNRPVPGANDNLSGVAVAAMVLKYFAKTPNERPNNVEIWAVAFGSEEGGMMGSKAMSQDVKKMLDEGTFPAESVWVLNYDSVGANGPLFIATAEPMYRVWSHNPEVYNQLAASAKKAGVDIIVKSLMAGTDSAPFSRLGIPAVGEIGRASCRERV